MRLFLWTLIAGIVFFSCLTFYEPYKHDPIFQEELYGDDDEVWRQRIENFTNAIKTLNDYTMSLSPELAGRGNW